MPNWCSNYIKINGDKGTIRTLTNIIKKLNSTEENSEGETQRDRLFYSLIGLPSHMTDAQYKEKWFDTNVEWFGTKWDITADEHMFDFSEDEIRFSCETAWSPPIPFLTNLCKMYKVSAYLFYSEGGVGFSGQTTYEWVDGELEVYDEEYEYLEGMYRCSKEEFWNEVEYRADCILDEEQTLEDFLSEFPFVDEEDKIELTRIYNETIENNDDEESESE